MPTVIITPLPIVAKSIGNHRILKGVSINHPLGDPEIPHDAEKRLRRDLVEAALRLLTA
jgi:glycine reductase